MTGTYLRTRIAPIAAHWPEDAIERVEQLEAALLLIAQEECREAGGTWCSTDATIDCEHNVARRALGIDCS
jgi:hypothetical protein